MTKYVIILDRGSRDQREAVQAIVKQHANEIWWHWFADTWLVEGYTAGFWRDAIRPVITPGSASVLVIELGEDWAYYGPKAAERMKWLHQRVKRYG